MMECPLTVTSPTCHRHRPDPHSHNSRRLCDCAPHVCSRTHSNTRPPPLPPSSTLCGFVSSYQAPVKNTNKKKKRVVFTHLIFLGYRLEPQLGSGWTTKIRLKAHFAVSRLPSICMRFTWWKLTLLCRMQSRPHTSDPTQSIYFPHICHTSAMLCDLQQKSPPTQATCRLIYSTDGFRFKFRCCRCLIQSKPLRVSQSHTGDVQVGKCG